MPREDDAKLRRAVNVILDAVEPLPKPSQLKVIACAAILNDQYDVAVRCLQQLGANFPRSR